MQGREVRRDLKGKGCLLGIRHDWTCSLWETGHLKGHDHCYVKCLEGQM
jgi:hypothetical protein